MAGRIWNAQIHHPGPAGGAGGDYWTGGLGSQLPGVYGELLGMRLIDIGYKKLARDGDPVEIGFEYAPHDPPPAWPDPGRPQQAHLDIEIADLDEAEPVAQRWGATRLLDAGGHRVFADAFGHPFCLYGAAPDGGRLPARIGRVVFDCFSPRAVAHFYGQLLGFTRRVLDTPERVVIAGPDPDQPMLPSSTLSSWQLDGRIPPTRRSSDLGVADLVASQALAERLGALGVPHPRGATVYADPAAHPFCSGDLAEPDPTAQDVHRQWRDARL